MENVWSWVDLIFFFVLLELYTLSTSRLGRLVAFSVGVHILVDPVLVVFEEGGRDKVVASEEILPSQTGQSLDRKTHSLNKLMSKALR